MSKARKAPPAAGQYCDVPYTTGGYQCHDPAVWLVFYADRETDETKHDNACGAHLNRLLALRRSQVEYSREQFRVLAWEDVVAASRQTMPPADRTRR